MDSQDVEGLHLLLAERVTRAEKMLIPAVRALVEAERRCGFVIIDTPPLDEVVKDLPGEMRRTVPSWCEIGKTD